MPEIDVTIRRARLDDWSNGLRDVVLQLLDVPDAYRNCDTGYEDILMDPTAEMFVAETEDEIVGCAVGHLVAQPIGRPALLIETVVVDEECRKSGVGRDLLAMVVFWGRSKGCYKAFGITSDAAGFYDRCGFETEHNAFCKMLT